MTGTTRRKPGWMGMHIEGLRAWLLERGYTPGSTKYVLNRPFVPDRWSLTQVTGNRGGPIPDNVRSFELFRRSLYEPEVITFDELVARAEWHIEAAASDSASDDLSPQRTDNPWVSGEDPWAADVDESPF